MTRYEIMETLPHKNLFWEDIFQTQSSWSTTWFYSVPVYYYQLNTSLCSVHWCVGICHGNKMQQFVQQNERRVLIHSLFIYSLTSTNTIIYPNKIKMVWRSENRPNSHMRCVSVLLTVVFSSKNLRCNVVGCSTKGTRGVTRSDSLLRKKKKRNKKI